MQRVALIDLVRQDLQRAGFAVSERCDLRPVSFDLVARRDNELLIVKVLTNVDALSMAVAHEIKLLSRFLEARPVLVGLRAGAGELEDGVVYNRHEVPIVTPATLAQFIHDGERPMVYAAPGGFYVQLDTETLRRTRADRELSLGVLAQIAGVSRRAIQMYEEGMSASIDAAMRLEEFLGQDLIRPLDPFAAHRARGTAPAEPEPTPAEDAMQALITRLLQGMGYDVRPTQRSPFQAISTHEDTLLTGMGEDSPGLRRRARIVESVSRVTQRPGFFVVEHTTRTQIHGLPVIGCEELERLSDPERVLELILERRAREH